MRTMPRIDSKKFYSSAIEMYGVSAKGVNWHSKESQKTRFDIIAKLLPQDLSQTTIADAGCGFGDLYHYLEKKNRKPKRYIGIDSLDEMCSITANNTGCEVFCKDICKENLPKADFYICSGALNVLEKFEVCLFIANCFSSSNAGFIFNTLFGEQTSQTYNYATLEEINSLAKELGAKEVILQDGYMNDDITVMFLK